MDEIILEQLKVLVERSVRPVRAMAVRKARIRTELLDHAAAIFEEEFEQTGEGQTALARVKHRFGDPEELSRQLQATVRWPSALIGRLENSMRQRPSDSRLRRAARRTLIISIALFSLFAMLVVPALLTQKGRAQLPLAAFFACLVSCFPITLIAIMPQLRFSLLGGCLRSWGKAAGMLAALTLASACLVVGLCWVILGDASQMLHDPMVFRSALVVTAFTPIAALFFALVPAKDARYQDSWEQLDIECQRLQ